MRRWRSDVPLLALTSGGESARFDRWTLLAPRTESVRLDAATCHAGALLEQIRSLAPPCSPAMASTTQRLPFASGWIGFLGYGCGALFEPTTHVVQGAHARCGPRPLPDAVLCRVPRALIYEHATARWFEVGEPAAQEVAPLVGASTQSGHNSWSALDDGSLDRVDSDSCFSDRVARAVEFIRAGDLYQANITQEFRAAFTGSARAFALDALESASPRYGAYLELDDDSSLLSLSPELFLAVDAQSRRVTTRPIKGTRPHARDCAELLASEKDAAELHMIVDLMRNDLGRVCDVGSVRVESARALEEHPTILHAVAEVTGTLAQNCDLADLVAATFPPGSVTGAPKVRAMQIIDELESSARGAYCGAIGFASGCGSSFLNVAIRTAQLSRAACANRWDVDYRAGCGIVAQSDPPAEDSECYDKTRALRNILRQQPTRTTSERESLSA